jgi:hypothetical protein
MTTFTIVCPVDSGTSGVAAHYRSITRETGVPILQVCTKCESALWPARLRCHCGAEDLAWLPAGRRGRIVSRVRVDVPKEEWARFGVPRKMTGRLPYTTVIVEPNDWPGTRMVMLLQTSGSVDSMSDEVSLGVEVDGDSVVLIAGDVP